MVPSHADFIAVRLISEPSVEFDEIIEAHKRGVAAVNQQVAGWNGQFPFEQVGI